MSWFENLPWWAKLPLLFGRGLMSAFSSLLPLGLQTVGLSLGIGLALFGFIATISHRINAWRKKHGKPSLTDALNMPALCSLEEAFKLSGELDRAVFLIKIRRLCGLGKVVALGKNNVARVSHDVIPSADWAAYRLVFAEEGGFAIPDNADDFRDALVMINLLEKLGPTGINLREERISGWCDLQFRTEEIIRQVRDKHNEKDR